MKYTLITFLLFILNVSAQKQIKGIIKSGESNQPIQYVTIIGASSGKTTVTNSEGRFQFTTDVNDKAIIIKHLDYFTKEIKVEQAEVFNIKLTPSTESLEEIVILSIPIRDEINKAIKTSQARFSNNLKLNTYYRELLYINGMMYQYEDAELDYYLQNINKSNTIVRSSRSVKFTNAEAKKFDSITNVNYYWGDLRARISNEFDFDLVKSIINSKEYDLFITRKIDSEGTELNVLNFTPVDGAKKATLTGTIIYGTTDYLIREIKADLDAKFVSNNEFMQQQNHRFKRNFYSKTTLFNLYKGKYALTYTNYRIFGISEVANQITKVGGFVELLVDDIATEFPKPKSVDFYDSEKLTRLKKNYTTKFWEKFNVVPLIYKEEQMLKQINK